MFPIKLNYLTQRYDRVSVPKTDSDQIGKVYFTAKIAVNNVREQFIIDFDTKLFKKGTIPAVGDPLTVPFTLVAQKTANNFMLNKFFTVSNEGSAFDFELVLGLFDTTLSLSIPEDVYTFNVFDYVDFNTVPKSLSSQERLTEIKRLFNSVGSEDPVLVLSIIENNGSAEITFDDDFTSDTFGLFTITSDVMADTYDYTITITNDSKALGVDSTATLTLVIA